MLSSSLNQSTVASNTDNTNNQCISSYFLVVINDFLTVSYHLVNLKQYDFRIDDKRYKPKEKFHLQDWYKPRKRCIFIDIHITWKYVDIKNTIDNNQIKI